MTWPAVFLGSLLIGLGTAYATGRLVLWMLEDGE